MKKTLVILAIVLIAFGLFLWNSYASQAAPGPGMISRSDQAPDFTLKTINGHEISLSSLRGKNVALIDFWATWCPPCRETMPHLQALQNKYGSKGLTIMSINLQERESTVKRFAKSNGYTFNILLDPTGEVADSYSVSGIPTLVLVDKTGNVLLKQTGYSPQGNAAIEQKIAELLK
ncbi:MAG: TlpA family protein disulfide reductase [Chloroflexi bacterium]|nr:TlpA family protein disulfide reductase [Chloroflexota bacterium]